MEKRLYSYLDVEPVVIRLIWLFFCCMGFGILAYLAAILIAPGKPMVQ